MIAASRRLSTDALPASHKIYVSGETHPAIRVPMREIALHPSAGEPPLTVYDTSGPYTDPRAEIDIARGLPRTREAWLDARGDVERYAGRAIDAADDGFVSEHAKRYVYRQLACASILRERTPSLVQVVT